jgi:monooxygenase
LRARLPSRSAYAVTRWKNVLLAMGFYAYCRRFPANSKRFLVAQATRALRGKSHEKHFTPSYDPWDQRMCLVPDGDLFRVLGSGRASVVTDHIESFTENGLALRSGEVLEADLVVTATGLKLKFLGGLAIEVDGRRIDLSKTMVYKGIMCSDVPNMAFAIGYTNASWTLKCDLTSEYVCRLLSYMDARGHVSCVPRRDPSMKEEPIIDFSSGYVRRAQGSLPQQGSGIPWKLYQNYALDRWLLRRAPIRDRALEFSKRHP